MDPVKYHLVVECCFCVCASIYEKEGTINKKKQVDDVCTCFSSSFRDLRLSVLGLHPLSSET